MYRAVVVALLCGLLVTPASAQDRPSAIVIAAEMATSMTHARSYPDGQGVGAQGDVYGVTLYETFGQGESEVFASIVRANDEPGGHAIYMLPGSSRDDGWARDRERYALDAYERALEPLPPGRDWNSTPAAREQARSAFQCFGMEYGRLLGAS